MKILAIETSCDESAVSIVEAEGERKKLNFKICAQLISSQAALHSQWGGVVPSLAKREHAKNLVPLLEEILLKARLGHYEPGPKQKDHLTVELAAQLRAQLEREPELLERLLQFLPTIKKPKLDAIAVTQGPGLEPALWVGINFAKALSLIWNLPLIPVNHLEGHLAAVLLGRTKIAFPALALIISGGHTELVLVKDWLDYTPLGATRDDAVGEAFDKVARILSLPYPGGPAISKLAIHGSLNPDYQLPRPMLKSDNYDFSFSGLKTAVLYLVKKLETETSGGLTNIQRADIARQFQQAVIEVLLLKVAKAIEQFQPRTIIVGGGVAANEELRRQFTEGLTKKYPAISLRLPDSSLATDNATMIATAGYLHWLSGNIPSLDRADGNLRLA